MTQNPMSNRALPLGFLFHTLAVAWSLPWAPRLQESLGPWVMGDGRFSVQGFTDGYFSQYPYSCFPSPSSPSLLIPPCVLDFHASCDAELNSTSR